MEKLEFGPGDLVYYRGPGQQVPGLLIKIDTLDRSIFEKEHLCRVLFCGTSEPKLVLSGLLRKVNL